MPLLTVDRHLTQDDLAAALRHDVRVGLTARRKELPPKYFYDAAGSELFERITRLPEYYPTRRERAILAARAAEVAVLTGADTLVELGSGSSAKTRLLLDALSAAGHLRRYVPVDVSEPALLAAADALVTDYPGLAVHPVVADFERHLHLLPTGGRRLVAFLGGTVGNLPPGPRARFLRELRAGLGPQDAVLLGTDLVKDPARLVRAYDDSAGVTAAFNRNVLRVLARELDGDVDPGDFAHVACWDERHEWIEMRLRARRALRVRLRALNLSVGFHAGEEVRTEISAKFRRDRLTAELAAAGLRLRGWWTDRDGDFAVSLSVPG